MAILDQIDAGLSNFGISPEDLAKRMQQRPIAPMPPGGAPAPANPAIAAPAGRMAAPPQPPTPAATPGRTAPAPAAMTGPGMTIPPPGPAVQRLNDFNASTPPPEPLHGWKRVLDTVGQVVAPRIEEAIHRGPQEYAGRLAQLEKAAQAEQGAAKEGLTEAQTIKDLREPTPKQTRDPMHVPAGEMVQQPDGSWKQVGEKTEKQPETKYEPRTIEDPQKPGKPLDVLFDPTQGQYLDPTTRQVIPNARSFQKPESTGNQPKQLVMVPQPDGTTKVVEALPGATLPRGATTLAEAGKEQTSNDSRDAAKQYADDYLKSGNFTGAGDEALMEKYFELAKPSSGFRMTQPQIEMLTRAQDIMNSVVAKGKHLFSPNAPYFSNELRQQIVDTMGNIERAGEEARSRTSQTAAPAGAPPGPPAPGMKWQQNTRTGAYRQVPATQ